MPGEDTSNAAAIKGAVYKSRPADTNGMYPTFKAAPAINGRKSLKVGQEITVLRGPIKPVAATDQWTEPGRD
jgi:hypothetical protein